jgi:hypothetical protein
MSFKNIWNTWDQFFMVVLFAGLAGVALVESSDDKRIIEQTQTTGIVYEGSWERTREIESSTRISVVGWKDEVVFWSSARPPMEGNPKYAPGAEYIMPLLYQEESCTPALFDAEYERRRESLLSNMEGLPKIEIPRPYHRRSLSVPHTEPLDADKIILDLPLSLTSNSKERHDWYLRQSDSPPRSPPSSGYAGEYRLLCEYSVLAWGVTGSDTKSGDLTTDPEWPNHSLGPDLRWGLKTKTSSVRFRYGAGGEIGELTIEVSEPDFLRLRPRQSVSLFVPSARRKGEMKVCPEGWERCFNAPTTDLILGGQ